MTRILAPKSTCSGRAHWLHLLPRKTAPGCGLVWPNLIKLLRRQSLGKSAPSPLPEVTFQVSLIPVPDCHSQAPCPIWVLSQKSCREAKDSQ